jgi:hypothetical protein
MAKQTFTTGQVLTAAQMTSLQETAMGGGPATAKTTSYVLVAADAGKTVAMDAAGATTITVNTGLFAAGDTVFIQNLGAGACTVTAGTATVATAGSLILPQNDAGILYFTSASAAIFYDYIQAGAVSPLTTKGDLYTFSTSDTRLGVGTDGHTLVADSATATGLKWAAPASGGGLVLINTTSFSAVSSQSINSVFSSTYDNYRIITNLDTSATSISCRFRLRVSGSDNSSSNYVHDAINPGGGGTASITTTGASPETSWQLVASGGLTSASSMDIYYPFATDNTGFTYNSFYVDSSSGTTTDHRAIFKAGVVTVTTSYDGFTFFPDSGTMTGVVSVYGYAK